MFVCCVFLVYAISFSMNNNIYCANVNLFFYFVLCQHFEKQMEMKAQQVQELHSQSEHLRRLEPERDDEIEARRALVAERYGTF